MIKPTKDETMLSDSDNKSPLDPELLPPFPSYTAIPNIILDYWILHLKGSEFILLIAICRKTFGWQKHQDKISISQFHELTGLGTRAIKEGLQRLLQLGLITKENTKSDTGGKGCNLYTVVVKGSNIGYKRNQGEGVKRTHTKETNTKEIDISKDISSTTGKNRPVVVSFDWLSFHFVNISEEQKTVWREAYPSVNVDQELKRMESWISSNKRKAPKKDFKRFINTWLSKAQDSVVLTSITPHRTNADVNYEYVQQCIVDSDPGVLDHITFYGKKCLVNTRTSKSLYFDLEHEAFKKLFFNIANVEED